MAILSLIAVYYVIGGRNWKNTPILLLIVGFAAGNILVHFELIEIADTAPAGFQIATLSVVLLIAVIGGRVTPAFTRNWLVRNGSDVSIVDPMQKFDVIALLSILAFVISYLFVGITFITAGIAFLAAVLNLLRLLRWKFWAVLSEPIMWILNLGYLWLINGLTMAGASYIWEGLSTSAALHSFTVGGFGTYLY